MGEVKKTEVTQIKGDSPLFNVYNGISEQIYNKLKDLGYENRALTSISKCGVNMGYMLKSCKCSDSIIPINYNCNKNGCPVCSKIRANKIRSKLKPLLQQYNRNPYSSEFLSFITFSPENFNSYKEGLDKIRKDFKEFLRLNYVKNRIKGGLIFLEAKTKNKFNEFKGWNIHIHALIYGKYLDNRIRGYCYQCGQNLIKQNRDTKKYYCANKKCNSENVKVKGDSKLVSLYKKVSKKSVMIDIQRVYYVNNALDYISKYVSSNKDNFFTHEHHAEYIFYNFKRKLFSTFGIFFKYIFMKPLYVCPKCEGFINYSFDYQVIDCYYKQIIDNGKINNLNRFL